jgi:large subunit ribosomal protein L4
MSPAQTSSVANGAAAQLPAEIFDAKVNVPLIHQVVVAQEAAARQGTHSTKTRGNVRGGGREATGRRAGRARRGLGAGPRCRRWRGVWAAASLV